MKTVRLGMEILVQEIDELMEIIDSDAGDYVRWKTVTHQLSLSRWKFERYGLWGTVSKVIDGSYDDELHQYRDSLAWARGQLKNMLEVDDG